MANFIRLQDVSFFYHPDSAAPALAHVSLNIDRGEMVALVGANGSGKSTLARLLNALLLPTSGKVITAGFDSADPANHTAIRSHVGLVFQRPQDQIVASTVEEEIAFGPANLGLPPREVRSRVEEALEQTSLTALRDRHPFFLSAGESQRLALAGVLAMQPRCVIFDESTAMLDPANRAAVMRQAKRLHQHGITIIFITHLMHEAAECERVIALHQGQVAMDGLPLAVFSRDGDLADIGLEQPHTIQAADMLRRFFPSLPADILRENNLFNALPPYAGKTAPLPAAKPNPHIRDMDGALIQVRDLSYVYPNANPSARPALSNLNMTVAENSLHVLIGASGSGKSTLLQHLNALIRPQSGKISVGPFDLSQNGLDTRALRRMVALAFQQPEDQIFEQFVGDEIAYGPRNLGYEGKLSDVVRAAMRAVGLEFESYKDRLTAELSGGERRKVALASILAIRADIFLLDEPLAGLDPHSRTQVFALLADLHQQGKTILISTHQYEQLTPVSDAVTVISGGKDILQGPPGYVFSQTQGVNAAGILPPFIARLIHALRAGGWPLDPYILDNRTLATALKHIVGRPA